MNESRTLRAVMLEGDAFFDLCTITYDIISKV